jgi:hypothetical protein
MTAQRVNGRAEGNPFPFFITTVNETYAWTGGDIISGDSGETIDLAALSWKSVILDVHFSAIAMLLPGSSF